MNLFFTNELTVGADGYVLIMPYLDNLSAAFPDDPAAFRAQFPNAVINADGSVKAVQRLDKAAAEAMVANFNSVAGTVKRFFRGVPIFLGHPDVPNISHRYPDKAQKGLIQDVQARADGMYAKPVFNDDGAALLEGPRKMYFSGRWSSQPAGVENGVLVYRPDKLKSAGMTPTPNLPAEMLNEAPAKTVPAEHAENAETNKYMTKAQLAAWLASVGITVANDAADSLFEQGFKDVTAKVTQGASFANEKATLAGQITEKESAITTLTTERDTARTDFANERAGRVTDLLEFGVGTGRITAAERNVWEGRLKANFANEATALHALAPKIKLAPVTHGDRRADPANDPGKKLVEFANAKFNADPDKSSREAAWNRAYAAACAEHPALLEQIAPKA